MLASAPGHRAPSAWVETRPELEAPARRIVSLSPHATELVFSAGAGAALVGAVAHSDYPPAARTLPRVGDAERVDLERLLALKPDLVVAWPSGNPSSTLQWLQDRGIPLYLSDPSSLAGIARDIEALGQLAGTREQAEVAARQLRQGLRNLRRRHESASGPSVFVQIWQQPLMTLNGAHILSRVLEVCGARNAFARLPGLSSTLDREAVLEADPEVILVPEAQAHWLEAWRQWPQLRAVRRQQLLSLPFDGLVRPTARVLEGARMLCARLAALS